MFDQKRALRRSGISRHISFSLMPVHNMCDILQLKQISDRLRLSWPHLVSPPNQRELATRYCFQLCVILVTLMYRPPRAVTRA